MPAEPHSAIKETTPTTTSHADFLPALGGAGMRSPGVASADGSSMYPPMRRESSCDDSTAEPGVSDCSLDGFGQCRAVRLSQLQRFALVAHRAFLEHSKYRQLGEHLVAERLDRSSHSFKREADVV